MCVWFLTGAIASSAPVLAEVDYVQYLQVVTASMATSKYGTQCTDKIENATGQIQALLQTSAGKKQLQQQFYLCAEPQNSNDVANFIATAGGAFMVREG